MKRLLIGALLAFAGSLLLGFGVRAGLDSYYITGVRVPDAPADGVVVRCGSLLAPAHDPDPHGCAALRERALIPAVLLSALGVCALGAGIGVLVMGRPRPPTPANPNPWELGGTTT